MSTLCLDLGTTTGWATARPTFKVRQFVITSGKQSFAPGRFEGGGMRFLKFQRWLDDIHALCPSGVTAIYFEEVRRHASTDAAHAYGGFMGKLTEWCEVNAVPYQGVPVGTIKKHATGKGNASKKEMIAAMQAKGHAPADDNEADALAILHWSFDNAPSGPANQRPAPHSKPQGRVPMEPVPVARRRMPP